MSELQSPRQHQYQDPASVQGTYGVDAVPMLLERSAYFHRERRARRAAVRAVPQSLLCTRVTVDPGLAAPS
jgi:hypothetical protein